MTTETDPEPTTTPAPTTPTPTFPSHVAAKPAPVTGKTVNSTDATQGESLAHRAKTRKAELEASLAKIPRAETRTRSDIEAALSALTPMLTGDTEHLSEATAAEINRWLESSKHLGEPTNKPPATTR